MTVGHGTCSACRDDPVYKLLPCRHTACSDHGVELQGTIEENCGVCGQRISFFVPVQVRPVSLNGIFVSANPLLSAQAQPFVMAPSSHNNGRAGTWNGQPAIRAANNVTPTPTRQNNSNNSNFMGAGDAAQRYVPPPLRNAPDPPVRPLSTVSNASFATQIALPEQRRESSLPTNGHSSLVSDRRSLTAQPAYGRDYSNGVYASNAAPTGPSSNASNYSIAATAGSAYQGLGSNIANTAIVTSVNGTGTGAANGAQRPAVDRASHYAAMIRAGRTEDPRDIDYGNPGRSKRLPPEPVNATPVALPPPRGRFINTDSTESPGRPPFPNTKGNAAAFLGTETLPIPAWLNNVGAGYRPSLDQVYADLPVLEACHIAQPTTAGVIKIINIPYACNRSEIVAFLGRTAQIVSQPEGSPFHAVHIMIDRQIGKTIDAYVEVVHAKEARMICDSFDRRVRDGRHAKIGDREVKVSVISQAELMAELFPTAKSIVWEGTTPKIVNAGDAYYGGSDQGDFVGFIPTEELIHMTKFAETPQRSPFMQRNVIRCFEHLVVILHKYPWYAVHMVLVKEVKAIFDTTLRTIRALMELLRKIANSTRRDSNPPTTTTLQELVVAALTCPGFSEGQKVIIVDSLAEGGHDNMIQPRGMNFRYAGNHQFSRDWPFLGLSKHPRVADQVVEYFASLLRSATNESNMTLADLHAMRASNGRSSFFGNIHVDYTGVMTVADLGRAEMLAIEATLRRVLYTAGNNGFHPSTTGYRS